MKPPLRNVAASVRDRLLKLARATGQPNGELLDRYCIERLLYRLSRSEHRDRFVLKGAMLLTAWGGGVYAAAIMKLVGGRPQPAATASHLEEGGGTLGLGHVIDFFELPYMRRYRPRGHEACYRTSPQGE